MSFDPNLFGSFGQPPQQQGYDYSQQQQQQQYGYQAQYPPQQGYDAYQHQQQYAGAYSHTGYADPYASQSYAAAQGHSYGAAPAYQATPAASSYAAAPAPAAASTQSYRGVETQGYAATATQSYAAANQYGGYSQHSYSQASYSAPAYPQTSAAATPYYPQTSGAPAYGLASQVDYQLNLAFGAASQPAAAGKKKKKEKKKWKLTLTGQLKVKVIEAKNLKAMDSNGKSDPYTVLEVDGKQLAKTKVKSKTLNPVWNEDIGAALSNAKKINLVVYDKDLLSSEVCGTTPLPMSTISSDVVDLWLDLKPQGKLHVAYSFAPVFTMAQVQGLTEEECVDAMKFGAQFQKQNVNKGLVAGNILKGRSETRFFQLSADERTITWTGGKLANRVELYDIRELRIGQNTAGFMRIAKEKRLEAKASISFSLIFGIKYKELNLIANSEAYYYIWVRGLSYLLSRPRFVAARIDEHMLSGLWRRADKNGDNSLSKAEVQYLLQLMNISLPAQQFNLKFETAAKASRELSYEKFRSFYYDIATRSEIVKLVRELTKDPNRYYLTDHEFLEFMSKSQKVHVTLPLVHNIICDYEDDYNLVAQNRIGITGFTNFLLSEFNDPIDTKYTHAYQDMEQPLAHYWINSSHNTYLLGNQYRGNADIEGYIRSLLQGCRCIELDCWDGSDGEPIITHGMTLVQPIKFKSAIDAIKKYAFVASPYPLILSIENHCGEAQQTIMGVYMQSAFGDMLIKGNPNVNFKTLPSPNQLKYKILVKGAKLPFDDKEEVYFEDEDDVPQQGKQQKKTPTKLAPELSNCVVYCKTTRFKGFDQASKKYWEMSSFEESKAFKLCSSNTNEFIAYNTIQLSRIYPAGTRVESGNYDPVPAWGAGCQLVALNYQTYDRAMQLNDIKFRVNGRTGYILKPAHMRGIPDAKPRSTILRVRIISGQNLPKPKEADPAKGDIIDPFVEVEVTEAEGKDKEKTKEIPKNGFNPIWQEQFVFTVSDIEQALFRVAVYDKEAIGANKFIGYWGAPVEFLRPGYRHLYLYDCSHPLGRASIFVHFEFQNN